MIRNRGGDACSNQGGRFEINVIITRRSGNGMQYGRIRGDLKSCRWIERSCGAKLQPLSPCNDSDWPSTLGHRADGYAETFYMQMSIMNSLVQLHCGQPQ